MSIAANPVGEMPVSAQSPSASATAPPPPKRRTVAKADLVAQPEPR